jgi:hypothetical protein
MISFINFDIIQHHGAQEYFGWWFAKVKSFTAMKQLLMYLICFEIIVFIVAAIAASSKKNKNQDSF